jgi:glycosyltransferase involved in cell wall biosynthesis
MKIAFVPHPFSYTVPPNFGDSVAILTYETARRLAESHEVVLYNRSRGRFWKSQPWIDGIRYRYIPVIPDKLIHRLMETWGRYFKPFKPKLSPSASSWYYRMFAWQVGLDLQKQQCDLVHIHTYSQLVPVIRALNPQIKIALHMHCEWLTQFDYATIAHRLSQVDLIIGCSSHITNKIKQRFPQFADRCRAVYNGVNTAEFTPATHRANPTTPKLLFVGRVSPEKGVHVLLDAFRAVAHQMPEVRLELIGPIGALAFDAIVGISDDPVVVKLASFYQSDADYLTQLQARIPVERLDQVQFVGPLPHADLVDRYRQADILINPSLSEAFGMSLVEAMATEVPTIGARVGGMTDIIADGETGLLVEPDQAAALAEAILQLLANPSLRRSMGIAGRQRVLDRFAWNRIVESLLTHYQQVCSPLN